MTCWWKAVAPLAPLLRSTPPRKGIRTRVAAERLGGQATTPLGIETTSRCWQTDGPKLAAALTAHIRSL